MKIHSSFDKEPRSYSEPEGYCPSDSSERHTRSMVFTLLLQEGPITAVEIAQRLNLSAVGVRRHLDIMTHSGIATIANHRTYGKIGRGRPAKYYELTVQGRKQHGQGYAQLAASAIFELREIAGNDAVEHFAYKHVESILCDVNSNSPCDSSIGFLAQEKLSLAKDIASRLTDCGFAATVRTVQDGIEICQHHCPVSDVAEQFPEFCLAEQEAFSQRFRQPIQRLATIAAGHRVCTTFIPLQKSTLTNLSLASPDNKELSI